MSKRNLLLLFDADFIKENFPKSTLHAITNKNTGMYK